MSAPTKVAVPAGRYGTDPAETERRVRRVYYAALALALAIVAAVGAHYLLKPSFNGEVVSFTVVSASEVQIRLDVDKPSDTAGSCTVRSRDVNGDEVGRLTVPLPKQPSSYDGTVTLRTSSLGTTGELVSCG
ncbi:DUF4307 domain-containing protein [Streptacidiphilus cavernicola]|uniref:DUF4307 domain-containing protein n=1 Tax=Streptacidiphilus cavernicola TaxID=3342716 RepID=A0ABV6VN38_9ACTN